MTDLKVKINFKLIKLKKMPDYFKRQRERGMWKQVGCVGTLWLAWPGTVLALHRASPVLISVAAALRLVSDHRPMDTEVVDTL